MSRMAYGIVATWSNLHTFQTGFGYSEYRVQLPSGTAAALGCTDLDPAVTVQFPAELPATAPGGSLGWETTGASGINTGLVDQPFSVPRTAVTTQFVVPVSGDLVVVGTSLELDGSPLGSPQRADRLLWRFTQLGQLVLLGDARRIRLWKSPLP